MQSSRHHGGFGSRVTNGDLRDDHCLQNPAFTGRGGSLHNLEFSDDDEYDNVVVVTKTQRGQVKLKRQHVSDTEHDPDLGVSCGRKNAPRSSTSFMTVPMRFYRDLMSEYGHPISDHGLSYALYLHVVT